MATFTEFENLSWDAAKDFAVQSAIDVGSRLARHAVDHVIPGAFDVGDVLLMTHDMGVGAGLLSLEFEQWLLSHEEHQMIERHLDEVQDLAERQETERTTLEQKYSAEIEEFTNRNAGLEEVSLAQSRQQTEARNLALTQDEQRLSLQNRQEGERQGFVEKQHEAELHEQEALRSKLAYCPNPTLEQSIG